MEPVLYPILYIGVVFALVRLRPEVPGIISAPAEFQRYQMILLIVLHVGVNVSIRDDAALLESIRVGDGRSELARALPVAYLSNACGPDSAGSAGWIWQTIDAFALSESCDCGRCRRQRLGLGGNRRVLMSTSENPESEENEENEECKGG